MDYSELGFYRVAAAVPPLTLGDPAANAITKLEWAQRARDRGACLVLFPELGITGHSCEDLFQSAELLARAGVEMLGRRLATRGGTLLRTCPEAPLARPRAYSAPRT